VHPAAAFESFVVNDLSTFIDTESAFDIYLNQISAKMASEEIDVITTF
jgi:hypothetical protein